MDKVIEKLLIASGIKKDLFKKFTEDLQNALDNDSKQWNLPIKFK